MGKFVTAGKALSVPVNPAAIVAASKTPPPPPPPEAAPEVVEETVAGPGPKPPARPKPSAPTPAPTMVETFGMRLDEDEVPEGIAADVQPADALSRTPLLPEMQEKIRRVEAMSPLAKPLPPLSVRRLTDTTPKTEAPSFHAVRPEPFAATQALDFVGRGSGPLSPLASILAESMPESGTAGYAPGPAPRPVGAATLGEDMMGMAPRTISERTVQFGSAMGGLAAIDRKSVV